MEAIIPGLILNECVYHCWRVLSVQKRVINRKSKSRKSHLKTDWTICCVRESKEVITRFRECEKLLPTTYSQLPHCTLIWNHKNPFGNCLEQKSIFLDVVFMSFGFLIMQIFSLTFYIFLEFFWSKLATQQSHSANFTKNMIVTLFENWLIIIFAKLSRIFKAVADFLNEFPCLRSLCTDAGADPLNNSTLSRSKVHIF